MLSSRPCSSFRSVASWGVRALLLAGTCKSAPRFFAAGCTMATLSKWAVYQRRWAIDVPRTHGANRCPKQSSAEAYVSGVRTPPGGLTAWNHSGTPVV